MVNVVTHNKDKKKNNSAITIVVTLLVIVGLLIGLNKILNKNTKVNTAVVEKVLDSSYTLGSADAKIKLVEYADFQCPACAAFSSVFPQVYKDINSKYGSSTLSLTYKYFPLVSIHRNAILAAHSAEAARLQGKFWDIEPILFAKQDEWGETLDAKSKIEGYARDIGLDMAKFVTDRDAQQTEDTVNIALAEATKLGLDHTPTIFMNGVEMKDLQLSASYIEGVIENQLKTLGAQPIVSSTNNQ